MKRVEAGIAQLVLWLGQRGGRFGVPLPAESRDSFLQTCTPTLSTVQSHIQRVRGTLSAGVRDCSTPSGAEVKNACRYISTPSHSFVAWTAKTLRFTLLRPTINRFKLCLPLWNSTFGGSCTLENRLIPAPGRNGSLFTLSSCGSADVTI